jgi:protein-tyrosine phosphatase
MARTDVHFHLLPGVDDGARDLGDSIEMAAAAAAEGTRTIVATPHVRCDHVTDVGPLPDILAEVEERLAIERISTRIVLGGELAHDMVGRLSQSELETIAVGPPRARWLLVETPFGPAEADFTAACAELRDRGFGLVIAHPERSGSPLDDLLVNLDDELESGAVLQVNSWSLEGAYGPDAQAAAERLVGERLAGVLATDAHPILRPPALRLGERLAMRCGLAQHEAAALVDARPGALVGRGLNPVRAPLA